MKSKKFKIVLPAFALFLAVSFAFATEANTVTQIGYYDHPILGVQQVPGEVDCQIQGTINCTYLRYQVFAETSLSTPLHKSQ